MGEVEKNRSFALVGHGGDGKTSLADAVAMAAGVTNRLGSVDDGSSFMNYLPEEQARRLSISASIATFDHEDLHLTMIDVPGDANFAGEVPGALQAVDHAVLVVNVQDGVKVGTEKMYRLAREAGLSVSAFANKMDHGTGGLDALAGDLEARLETRVVRLHLPIGEGEAFSGYVDLLTRQAVRYKQDGSGSHETSEVPAELADAVEEAHMALVEAVAEGDDAMLEKYLEEGELSPDEVASTLKKGVAAGVLLPLVCGAASHNVGAHGLLALLGRVTPSPAESPPRRGRRGEEEVELVADPSAPLVAYVFKSVADRYAGTLSVFRVYSGTLTSDMTVVNDRTGSKERISKLLALSGENTDEIKEVGPGEIAAIPKLRDTHTGDALCTERTPTHVIAPEAPRGVISFAIEAATKGEEDKVFEALGRLVEEDPSLRLERDSRTGEFLLNGLGQLHIEVTLEKLRRLFKVEVTLKPPKVPYMETIKGKAANVEGKLKKQSGGRGQFGVCFLTLEPGERGSGVQFMDEIVGGAIPRQYIPAVEKGVRETCERGVVAGYPFTDVIVRCIDGKHHSVDSSEMAFKTAASLGIKQAVQIAKPTLLEPIMEMEVTVPDDFVGDVMGNLNSRRGRVAGVDARGSMQSVRAQVPMAEVLSYASDLTSITGGQGSFTMEFSHYEEVPKEVQDRIVAEAAVAKDED